MSNERNEGAPPLSSRPEPSVCCILVNWNGCQDTIDCLSSLRTQTYPNLRILVVDNASSDGSPQRIRQQFPEVELIEAGENLGFPRACNVGLRSALQQPHDLFWVLNNDTLCPPDTLRKLVDTAQQTAQAGITGTVLFYAHNPSQVQAWGGGHVLPAIAYSTHFTTSHAFGLNDYATFASVLIRREVFESIGLLYEGSFMYYEDSDFCLRAHSAGWTISVASTTAVLHKEGASMPGPELPAKVRIITAAGLRFIRRHSRWAPLTLPVFAAMRFFKRLLRGQFPAAKAVLQGTFDYVKSPASFLDIQPVQPKQHLNPRK